MVKKIIKSMIILGFVSFLGCGVEAETKDIPKTEEKNVIKSSVETFEEELMAKHLAIIDAIQSSMDTYGIQMDRNDLGKDEDGIKRRDVTLSKDNEEIKYEYHYENWDYMRELMIENKIKLTNEEINKYLKDGFDIEDTKFVNVYESLLGEDYLSVKDKLNKDILKILGEDVNNMSYAESFKGEGDYFIRYTVETTSENETVLSIFILQSTMK